MARDTVPYCMVHNKFQTVNGRWIDAGEKKKTMIAHLRHTHSKTTSALATDCDDCENPNQTKMLFKQ